jgi:hypothetical protein
MQVFSIENLENIVIPSSSSSSSPAAEGANGSTTAQEVSSNNLLLRSTNNYSLSLFGYVDVMTDDAIEWQNVLYQLTSSMVTQ